MKKIILLLSAQMIFVTIIGAQTFLDVTTIGGASTDAALKVRYDHNNNKYVGGVFSGTVTFGSTQLTSVGDLDVFVAKIAPNGNYLWIRQVGGTGVEYINDMAVDGNGNCYIAGYYTNTATAFFPGGNLSMTSNNGSSDMFALKYNSDGSYGHGTIGGYSELNGLTSIAVSSDNRVYVGGYKEISASVTHSFIGILPWNGVAPANIWTRQFTSNANASVMGISVSTNGNLHIAGHFIDNINLGTPGNITASSNLDAFILHYDKFGNYINAGTVRGVSTNGHGISFRGISHYNNSLYLHCIFLGDITLGSATISSLGDWNGLILKVSHNTTSNNYTIHWNKPLYGTDFIFTHDINAQNNNIYVTGSFEETMYIDNIQHTAAGGDDIYAICLNDAGNLNWKIMAGNSGFHQRGYGITGDANGNATVVGAFGGTVNFGTITRTSAGGFDGFIATISGQVTPTMDISYSTVPKCPGTDFDVNITTSSALDASNTFTILLSDASGSFNSPTLLKTVNANTTNVANVSLPGNLPAGTSYRIRVDASSPALTSTGNNMQVLQKPSAKTIVGNSAPKSLENEIYSVSETTGSEFHWDIVNGSKISGGNSNLITVVWSNQFSTGKISVVEINQSGCKSDTASMNISIIDGVGIDKLPIAGITVYPNPANDILSIQSEQQVLENLNIIIYNLNGQVILENKLNSGLSGDSYTLNISELQPAVYILELRNSHGVNKYRIVKY